MDFAPVYLVERLFYRLKEFFHHWYVDGSRRFAHKFISTLEDLDRTVALKITLRYFFQPLYRDYSPIGRILGIIFRSGRVVIGILAYFFIALVFLVVYIIWIALPAAILIYGAKAF